MKIIIAYILVLFISLTVQATTQTIGQSTGFKLPRFVSTKSNESNLRIGADTLYPIKLTYTQKNFPLKIIDEYKIWRKVADIDGNIGWMHKSLVQGNRYGIINTSHSELAQIYKKPEGILIGRIGNRNIVKIKKCFKIWCEVKFNHYSGWINKSNIWGVDDKEEFNLPFYHSLYVLYWKTK